MLFFSCNRVLLRAFGVRSPQIETHQSLKSYIEKNDLIIHEICAAKDSTRLMQLFKIGFPEAVIFNQSGYFVDYRDSTESCNAGVDVFIAYLPQNQELDFDLNYHADSLFQKFATLPAMNPMIFDSSYDYTIVMT